jgi:hypothetical protein
MNTAKHVLYRYFPENIRLSYIKVNAVVTNVLKECSAFILRFHLSWTASIFRVNPDDGGSLSVHNVGAYIPCYTASHPRRP